MKYINKLAHIMLPANYFRLTIITSIILLGLPQYISANGDRQSMLELRKISLQFIQSKYSNKQNTIVRFARWDKRTNLVQCKSSHIKAFYPGHNNRLGNVSIGLRCTKGKMWVIYLRVHVSIKQHIVIAKRNISRGSIITKQHLTIENKEISNNNTDFYSHTKYVIGMLAKHHIKRGTSIRSKLLVKQKLVKRGAEVIIIATISGLTIRTKGRSLMDGTKGQFIRVKNIRSQKEIQAVVTAPNTVKVQM